MFHPLCVSSILTHFLPFHHAGPFFFKDSQAPSYGLGIGAILVCNILEMLLFFVIRCVYVRRNTLRDREQAKVLADGVSEAVPHVNETTFSDLTDKQNVKYVLPATPSLHNPRQRTNIVTMCDTVSDMFIR